MTKKLKAAIVAGAATVLAAHASIGWTGDVDARDADDCLSVKAWSHRYLDVYDHLAKVTNNCSTRVYVKLYYPGEKQHASGAYICGGRTQTIQLGGAKPNGRFDFQAETRFEPGGCRS